MESQKKIRYKKKMIKRLIRTVEDMKYKSVLQFLVDHYSHPKKRFTRNSSRTDHIIQTIFCQNCNDETSFYADELL